VTEDGFDGDLIVFFFLGPV